MKKKLNLGTKDMIMFILRVIWLVIALVIWIVALNFAQSGSESAWWEAGGLCVIPILFPILRFIWGAIKGGAATGSTVWDIDITSSGRVYATNHAWSYGLLAGLFAIVLAVVAGLIILPIYWLYIFITTLIVFIKNFN